MHALDLNILHWVQTISIIIASQMQIVSSCGFCKGFPRSILILAKPTTIAMSK